MSLIKASEAKKLVNGRIESVVEKMEPYISKVLSDSDEVILECASGGFDNIVISIDASDMIVDDFKVNSIIEFRMVKDNIIKSYTDRGFAVKDMNNSMMASFSDIEISWWSLNETE